MDETTVKQGYSFGTFKGVHTPGMLPISSMASIMKAGTGSACFMISRSCGMEAGVAAAREHPAYTIDRGNTRWPV